MPNVKTLVLTLVAVAALSLAPARAADGEGAIVAAIRSADINTLRQHAGEMRSDSRGSLVEGAIAALLNDDARAETALGAAVAAVDLDNVSRARAAPMLVGVSLRQARFADAVTAFHRERELLGGVFSEPGEARSLAVAEVFSSAPMMTVAPERGEVSVRNVPLIVLPDEALTFAGGCTG